MNKFDEKIRKMLNEDINGDKIFANFTTEPPFSGTVEYHNSPNGETTHIIAIISNGGKFSDDAKSLPDKTNKGENFAYNRTGDGFIYICGTTIEDLAKEIINDFAAFNIDFNEFGDDISRFQELDFTDIDIDEELQEKIKANKNLTAQESRKVLDAFSDGFEYAVVKVEKFTNLMESKTNRFDEKVHKILNEDAGDVIRSSHTLNGNPYTETEEGKVTVEFLGVPVEYQLIKHEEKDKDTKDIVKTRYEIEVTRDSNDIIRNELQKKIEETFKSQLKDLYNVDVTYIGGSSMLGIPINAEYKK